MDLSSNYGYNKNLKHNANKLRKEMTKAEACLWKYVLRAGGIMGFTFRRQRPVLNFITDFMCKELMLIIEVDGITHNYEEVAKKDKKRQIQLQKIGFRVLIFSDDDVLNQISSVARTIENEVKEIIDQNHIPLPNPRIRKAKL